MKKIVFTMVILLAIGLFQKVHAWIKMSSGTTANLNSVFFTSVNTGYIVGSAGTILKTPNAGNGWMSLNSGTTQTLYSIYFVNANVGYTVGGLISPIILKTTDGGTTWSTQTSPVNKRLLSVRFINDTTGFSVGASGTIIKTIDGGNNWIAQASGTTQMLYSVFFTDINNGYAVGNYGTILKTNDGGINWISQTSVTASNLFSVCFTSTNKGYVVGSNGTILKTTDGGQTWTQQSSNTTITLNSVCFLSESTGYAVGNAGLILKTIDAGITWSEQGAYNYSSALFSIFFTSESIGYAVGSSGVVLKTYISGGYSCNDNLSVNNIKAKIYSNDYLFWDKKTGKPAFEAPNGSGKHSNFATSVWIGGRDVNGQLRVAGQRFGNGDDFFPGPIMDPVSYQKDIEKWDRVWRVTKPEINYHISQWSSPGYIMPKDIAEWPGNGDTSKGQLQNIAPYYDLNNDGRYNPENGDYPLIKGDEALFFVFNGYMNAHTESDGALLGVEVHAMAYAFDCPDDSAFWNTIFINYKVINRTLYSLFDLYIGVLSEIDLGDANDDFIECDVSRSSFYCFNGDNMDGDGSGLTYGINPPAQSVTILGGPYMDADTSDYGSSGVANGCDESINGINFNDGIIDNERLGMTSFIHFDNSTGVNGNPVNTTEYYNYLLARWRDGTHMTYGGDGYSSGSGINASFAFPGNPTTDICGWGSDGEPQGNWSEITENNTPGDRRGMVSTGPFNLLQWTSNEFDLAFVFGRDYLNSGPLASITIMKQRIDSVRYGFIHNISPCGSFNYGVHENKVQTAVLNIYPNPASSYFTISMQNNNENKTVSVYTMDGVLVKQQSFSNEKTQVETSGLSSGLYVVEVRTSKEVFKKKLMVIK